MLNRVFLSQGGLTELPALSDFQSTATSLTLNPGEYLYISSPARFNSQYLKITTPAGAPVGLTVEYWGGSDEQWVSVVDQVDRTDGLTSSGLLSFTLDREKSWALADSSDIAAVSSKTIYDSFWCRIGVDALASFDLNWLGYLFVDTDSKLYTQYPLLGDSDFMAGFGVTDWEKQRIEASELVMVELIGHNHMQNPGQLMSYNQMRLLTIPYTAYLAFKAASGDYYKQAASDAYADYQKVRQNSHLLVDTNGDGNIQPSEHGKPKGVILNR